MTRTRRRPTATAARVLAALVALSGLAACSYRDLDEFNFERFNPFAREQERLPGEREAIITDSDPLTADPEAARNIPPLPPARGNADWAQPGGTASNAPGHLALAGEVGRSWTTSAARGSTDAARLAITPIVYDGQVYAMDAIATVTSVSPGGGRNWSVRLKPDYERDDGVLGGGLAADGGRLFAATGYGDVFGLDPSNGSQLWVARLKVPIRSAPTAADGRVFVVTADNQIHALSAENGGELWTYRGIPETAGLLANTSPAVAGETVVVPYSSGEVVAFNAANGTPMWADTLTRTQLLTSLSALNDVAAKPAIDGEMVFAVSVSGRMIAVNRKTGERVWTRNIAGTQTPYPAGDSVYVVSLSGTLAALARRDGKARWVARLPGDAKTIWNGPVLAGGRLWLSSTARRLVAVDATSGEVVANYDIGAPSFIPPIVAAGSLFLLLDNGNLAAFN